MLTEAQMENTSELDAEFRWQAVMDKAMSMAGPTAMAMAKGALTGGPAGAIAGLSSVVRTELNKSKETAMANLKS